ncbi:hypothetical protein Herbaro_08905 [Herbaspirillum sp. WKF16]|uniref:hypothetical protein n=1 Tax=Herbaspirillum sp. WKF16 TaxID=3028312 RepID=UPI0023A9B7B7|nr:hypothetical protein [Herbaspirillum sp. WKF16]WDZ97882.1 hypothetical protein Herbaro_08905 [Herbaspirillum sp. WKF16]
MFTAPRIVQIAGNLLETLAGQGCPILSHSLSTDLFTASVSNFFCRRRIRVGRDTIGLAYNAGLPDLLIRCNDSFPITDHDLMRRLLLLLLTFLLPLQLLAATVGELPARAGQGGDARVACPYQQASSPAAATTAEASARFVAGFAATSDADAGAGQDGGEDDVDVPAAQAELEDHTIPARIATPDIPWQSFPHAFAAPLSWPSFVRDQLRPPPLA